MILDFGSFSVGLEQKADIVFVSHAHSDHLVRKASRIIASPETVHLAGLPDSYFSSPELRMANAGHILGARQLVADLDGERLVYTGDFQMKDNIITKAAEVVECDTLLLDGTYKNLDAKFPDPFEVYDEMVKWINQNQNSSIIIGANAVGKAQEIIMALNEAGIEPVVSSYVSRFTEKYRELGINLRTSKIEEVGKDFVAITRLHSSTKQFAFSLSQLYGKKFISAIATGLAARFEFPAHRCFLLSNHADKEGIEDYINRSGAKRVEFFC
ncbi:MAG: hypothetical protein QW035_04410 [Candidatus Anstonellales archaeon]